MKYQKIIRIVDNDNERTMNRFQLSAIIGMWRMGADDATISGILNCSLSAVFSTIKSYKETLK